MDHTLFTSHPSAPTSRQVSRRTALSALGALGALMATPALAGPAAATTYPNPNNTPTNAIRSYGDMIDELNKLVHTSKGAVRVTTLSEVGTAESLSEQGRELYVAQVGTGPRNLWIQGRIHGNEPYGLESLLDVLKSLASNGNRTYRSIREAFTVHFIPIYNPDGSEMNTRTTTLWDRATNQPRLGANGRPLTVDLNRDWAVGGFQARESRAWYEYWTMVKPEYALDIHHQGMKVDRTTGDAITFSLGVSLAPGGPTLPGIRNGEYDVLTRQMAGHVWQQVDHRGHISTDRYDVGRGVVIDIRGGVVSAMMLGLNWNGLNSAGHSNAAIFFETSGNTSEGSLGQKGRGKFIQQNVLGIEAWLSGLASGAIQRLDPEIWEQIPHDPVEFYFTDWGGTMPA